MNEDNFKKVSAAVGDQFNVWRCPTTCDIIVNVDDSIVRRDVGAPPIPRDYADIEQFIEARKAWVVNANNLRSQLLTNLQSKLAPKMASIEADHWDILRLVITQL